MIRRRSNNQTDPVPPSKRQRFTLKVQKPHKPIHPRPLLDETTRHNVQQQARKPISKPQHLSPQQRTTTQRQRQRPTAPPPTTNIQRSAPRRPSAIPPAAKEPISTTSYRSDRRSSNGHSHAHFANRNVQTHSNSQSTDIGQPPQRCPTVQSIISDDENSNTHSQWQNESASHTTNVSPANHSELTTPPTVTPLQRKEPRKKKTNTAKIKTLWQKIRADIGNHSLCQCIVFDVEDLKWWYCTDCDDAKDESSYHKSVRVRAIVQHLKSNSHHNNLKGKMLQLDIDRRQKEQKVK